MMQRRRALRLFFVALIAGCATVGGVHAASASTAAGTTISNTSSATYQDANSAQYSTNSNAVSVVVQNAPSITVAAGAQQTVAPGQSVTDAFTITNTGNAAGNVQLTAAATIAGTDSASTTVTYTYGGQSYADYGSLNTALNLSANAVAVNASISVGVVYALASSASAGDVSTNVSATIAYAAVGSAPAQTSAATTSASPEDDLVKADARVDLQLSSTQNGSSGAITYTLKAANDSATWGAKDLTSVKALLGNSVNGVFISAKLPQVANTPLTVSGNVTVTSSTGNGYPSAGSPTTMIYYTNSTSGSSGWTVATGGAVPSTAYYIGVLLSGGTCTINGSAMSGIELCPVSGSTASAGNVPNPAITLTFTVNQSTANGSADAGSTKEIFNSLSGDNATAEHVVGPGIATGSLADVGATAANLSNTGVGVNNVTAQNTPSGASQLTSDASLASYAVANGPFGNPLATGAFDGSANDGDHDFTAVSFLKANDTYQTTNTTATYAATTASVTSAAVSGINVESTLKNTGNKSDTYTIVATAPTGWTVTLAADNSGAPGSALGTTGSVTSTATYTLASGASLNYWAVYNAPAGVAYLSHGVGTVVATSNATATVHNQTNHLLYAGFVAVTTTAATVPNCPAGVSVAAGTVCPSGTISYTIDYRNIVATADSSSVPAVSFAGVMTKAGTLYVTSDGTSGTGLANNWFATTGGPAVAPTDTTSGTTFEYFTGSSGGTSIAANFQVGVSKFSARVGGANFQLAPAGYTSQTAQGAITFSVTVK